MHTGLVSITFRKKSVEEIIALVKEAGLTSIEWGGDVHVPHGDIETAKRVGELTREAGLTCVSYGSYYHCTPEDVPFETVLDTAVALGAGVIRVWAGKKNHHEAEPEYREAVYEDLRRCVALAAEKGILISTEYHHTSLTNNEEGALAMLNAVPGLYTHWQPRNYYPDVQEQEDIIRLLGDRVIGAHVFHWEGIDSRPLEEGTDCWDKFTKALSDGGNVKFMTLEFVLDGAAEAFLADAEVLKKIVAKCCTK
ncbi:MAG: sugar phosphate isomerase/epimerase [Ruminococcaceae bacterium]|nr:sugar phosphate isomerase/epimerase [Oscillospiraceae bacterium]